MKIGLIILTDPSAAAKKQELLVTEMERVIASFFIEPSQFVTVSVPNDREELRTALVRLCDKEQCPLVLTTGGIGPTEKDFTADITLEVVHRPLPGFGEIIRTYSYERFKVSILSRAEAGVRGKSLVINFPARPKPVQFCLRLVQEAVAEAVDQITGERPTLRGDEVVIPVEKYLPFLKHFRVKPDPRGEHPTFKV